MAKETIKIDKTKLQEALSIVKPGLASKDMIEQATSFAFLNGRVVTYNDAISISHPVEGIEFTGAIQANELYSLLSKISADSISIEEKDEASLVLKAGRSKAGFTLEKEIKLPLDEIDLEGGWKKLPKGFASSISKVISAASNDMSRPLLTCIHINKSGYIEATDGLRASRVVSEKKFKFNTFLLPTSAALPLTRVNPTEVLVSSGWIHFKNDKDTIFSTRSIEGDFPNIDHLFEMKKEGAFTFPKELKEVVHRAEPFYKRTHILQETVILTVESNKLNLSATAEGTDSWFKESVKSKGINDMSFSIPPSLLLDILQGDTEVEIKDRFLCIEKDNWSYLCCINKL